MDRKYILELFDSFGTRLGFLDERVSWSATRVANESGAASFVIPLSSAIVAQIKHDCIIRILQSLDGYAAAPIDDTIWIIDSIVPDLDLFVVTVNAKTPIDLLNRRIVTALETTPEADKTGQIDNVMKQYVLREFGISPSIPTRQIQGFSVAGQVVNSFVPSLAADNPHKGSLQNLLQLCQELCNDCAEKGVPLYFDVVPLDSNMNLEFRTLINLRGVWRTELRVGSAFGTASGVSIVSSREEEINVGYGAGAGEGTARILGTAIDTARSTATRFARREGVIEQSDAEKLPVAEQAAKRLIYDKRMKLRYNATLIEAPSLRYGIHVGFGDLVFATEQYFGQNVTFQCYINNVTIGEDEGGSQILSIALTGESNVNLFY